MCQFEDSRPLRFELDQLHDKIQGIQERGGVSEEDRGESEPSTSAGKRKAAAQQAGTSKERKTVLGRGKGGRKGKKDRELQERETCSHQLYLAERLLHKQYTERDKLMANIKRIEERRLQVAARDAASVQSQKQAKASRTSVFKGKGRAENDST